jgi:hypothetical protein
VITQAKLFGREDSIEALEAPEVVGRGQASRRIGARDLIEFGRCPRRWLETADPEERLPADGPSLTEWLALDPAACAQWNTRRPDTYEAMRLECPKCNSVGPAKVCTRCGQRRRNVVAPRAWSSAAKVCAAWIEKAEKSGQRIAAPGDYDRALLGANAVLRDKCVQATLTRSLHLRTLHGIWQDQGSETEIPVWSRASLVPSGGNVSYPALAQITESRNVDPKVWESAAVAYGLHLHAALTLALWNKAADADVREYLWIVVEKDEPRVVARRRASQELLHEGRTRVAELMSAYARCLKTGLWPRFEAEDGEGFTGWPLVALQPWMTSGAGPHGGYFAPDLTS